MGIRQLKTLSENEIDKRSIEVAARIKRAFDLDIECDKSDNLFQLFKSDSMSLLALHVMTQERMHINDVVSFGMRQIGKRGSGTIRAMRCKNALYKEYQGKIRRVLL